MILKNDNRILINGIYNSFKILLYKNKFLFLIINIKRINNFAILKIFYYFNINF